MSKSYVRYVPTSRDVQDALRIAARATTSRSTTDIRATIVALVLENMRLLREVQDHRQERGYELLEEHSSS